MLIGFSLCIKPNLFFCTIHLNFFLRFFFFINLLCLSCVSNVNIWSLIIWKKEKFCSDFLCLCECNNEMCLRVQRGCGGPTNLILLLFIIISFKFKGKKSYNFFLNIMNLCGGLIQFCLCVLLFFLNFFALFHR